MRILEWTFLSTFILLTVGCWTLSVYPLYTEQDVFFDPSLLGIWHEAEDGDSASVWTFDRKTENSYRLAIQEANKSAGVFDVHLLRLGNHLLLDFYPEAPDDENEIFTSHVILAHSFWRVAVSGDSLRLAAFDSQWLRQRIDAGEVTIAYQERSGLTVLTAPTADLQRFILAHIEEAFEWSAKPLVKMKTE